MQTINSAQRGTIAAQGEAAAANERLTAQLLAAKDEVAAAKGEVAAAKGDTATKTAHLYEQLLAAEREKHKLAMELRNIHPRLDRLAVCYVLGAPMFSPPLAVNLFSWGSPLPCLLTACESLDSLVDLGHLSWACERRARGECHA